MKNPHHWNHECNCGEVKRVQDCIFSIVKNFSKQVIAGPVDVIIALKWANPMGKSSSTSGWQSACCCEKCSSECSGKQPTGSAWFPQWLQLHNLFEGGWGGRKTGLLSFIISPPPSECLLQKLITGRTHELSRLLLRHNQCQPACHCFCLILEFSLHAKD